MATATLLEEYKEKILPAMMSEMKLTNRLRVPKLTKVVLNSCLKEAVADRKVLDSAIRDIAAITGQQPVMTRAKKAISNFKLREGMPIGCRVTLRGAQMYDFVQKLCGIALPRMRDFKGVSFKGFDGRGNYTLGLTEQLIFPEIDLDKSSFVFGMSVTFVTTAENNADGQRLLAMLGMPFRKKTA